jgi:hypothetical protein
MHIFFILSSLASRFKDAIDEFLVLAIPIRWKGMAVQDEDR